MRRVFAFTLLILLATVCASSPSWAEGKKFALVIANSAYGEGLSPLANPPQDAATMAQALQHAGFAVTVVRDADLETMQRAVIDHAERVRAAGDGAVSFIHFSGHGSASLDRTEDYLIPIGAAIRSELSLPTRAYRLSDILRTIQAARPAISFISIDACRDVAFPHSVSRSVERGLAKIDGAQGTLIAFATAPDKTAEDGADGHGSAFSLALAAEIAKGGESHIDVFKNVQIAVAEATGDRQVPWYTDGIVGRYTFTSDQTAPSVLNLTAANSSSPPLKGPDGDACRNADIVPIAKIVSSGFARNYQSSEVRTAAQFVTVGSGNWMVRGINQEDYLIITAAPLDAVPSAGPFGAPPIIVALPKTAGDIVFALRQGDLIALTGVTRVTDYASQYTEQISRLKALGEDSSNLEAAYEKMKSIPPNVVFVGRTIVSCPG